MDYNPQNINLGSTNSSSEIGGLIAELKETNRLLRDLVNLFIKYDSSYQTEIIKDQGRTDILN